MKQLFLIKQGSSFTLSSAATILILKLSDYCRRPISHSGLVLRSIQMMSSTKFQPVVLSGPSGSGKSTLLKRLMDEYKDCFAFSVSHTTRKPRPGEKHGTDYFYVDKAEMEKMVATNEFIEHAVFSGNMYGTSKQSVKDIINTGKICVLDIDKQGVQSVKQTDLNPRYIFIQPPSLESLELRLKSRGTECEDSLQNRLATATEALEYSKEKGAYDHIIVNDNLDVAYEKLKGILIKDIHVVMQSLGR